MTRRRYVLAPPLLLSLVVACGNTTAMETAEDRQKSSVEQDSPRQTGAPEEPGPRRFAQLFGGYLADYIPVNDLGRLAATSDLVVQGTLSGISSGRILYAESSDDPEAAQALALQVRVAKVIRGSAATAGESIYVELPSGGRDTSEFIEALPRDATTVLYLVPAPHEEGAFVVGNAASGRPQGEPLWVPNSPQGFMLMGQSSVLLPLDSARSAPGTVRDAVPSTT